MKKPYEKKRDAKICIHCEKNSVSMGFPLRFQSFRKTRDGYRIICSTPAMWFRCRLDQLDSPLPALDEDEYNRTDMPKNCPYALEHVVSLKDEKRTKVEKAKRDE